MEKGKEKRKEGKLAPLSFSILLEATLRFIESKKGRKRKGKEKRKKQKEKRRSSEVFG